MARRGVVVPALSEVSGVSRATVERMCDALKAAGMGPVDYRGRGDRHGHFELNHLADFVMAFAASNPADAAEAVRRLRPLRDLDGTFGDFLESTIHQVALFQHDRVTRPIFEILPDALLLGFTLPNAVASYSGPNGWVPPKPFTIAPADSAAHSYDPRTNAVLRNTMVQSHLLWVAAELWLDTLKRQEIAVASTTKDAARAPTQGGIPSDQPAPRAKPLKKAKPTRRRLGVQPKPPEGQINDV